MIETTYLYQKTNETLDELEGNTGLAPTSKVWSLTDQATVIFPDVLSSGDKATLDDYMLTHGYAFVSQVP